MEPVKSWWSLDLIEGSNVYTLNKILKLGDLFLQDVGTNFVVLDHAVDLQFLDAVTHWHQFGRSPQEPVHLHRAQSLLQLRHISLIVPRLDIQNDRRLGDEGGFLSLL